MRSTQIKIFSLFFLFSCFLVHGQTSYVLQKSTSLSSAAEVITLQQPTTGAKYVELKSAYVDCSAACTLTVERNGLAATTTTLNTAPVNTEDAASKVKGFYSSNVGVGTVLSVVSLPASGSVVFDLSAIHLRAVNDPGQNFTIRTSSITGAVNIVIQFTER